MYFNNAVNTIGWQLVHLSSSPAFDLLIIHNY